MKNASLCPHCDLEKKSADIPPTTFNEWYETNNYQPCAQCHGIGNIPLDKTSYHQALLPALLPKNPTENRPSA